MVIDSFDDVRGLDEIELRALLEHGRPEQRVWAIWALALRSVSHASELAHHEDPDPGVRRNLAVVLAGHGEHELLVALAHRDPAPEVRAAAMQLVARIAIDGVLPAELVVDRTQIDAPEVKIAVLGTMFEGAPEWLVELAQRLLSDKDSDVRYEAFEALVRAEERAPALMWLEEAPEMEARLALMRSSARAKARACAELIAGSSRRTRRLLVESVRAPTWRDLGPAIGRDPMLVRALVARDPTQLDAIDLVALVAATLADERGGWLTAIRPRLAQLESAYEPLSELLPLLHELVARRLGEIDGALAQLDDEARVELEDVRIALEATLDEISRLLVH